MSYAGAARLPGICASAVTQTILRNKLQHEPLLVEIIRSVPVISSIPFFVVSPVGQGYPLRQGVTVAGLSELFKKFRRIRQIFIIHYELLHLFPQIIISLGGRAFRISGVERGSGKAHFFDV